MQIDDYQIISIDIQEGKPGHNLSKSIDSLIQNQQERKNQLKISTNELLMNNSLSSSWTSITSSLSNMKDSLMYNYLSFNYPYDIFTKPIQLFDKHFTPNQKGRLAKYLNLFFLMTYRANFPSLLNQESKKVYTSDCGWGCMVRCGQMMLSNAILSFKLYSIDQYFASNKAEAKDDSYLLINDETINKKRIETILLFFDFPINMADIVDKDEFFSQIEEMTIEYDNHQLVIPPFSLLNIFIQGRQIVHKEPGEWFSDVNLIKVFYAVQRSFRGAAPFEVFYFTEGFIDEKYLLAKCFTEKTSLLSLESLTRKDKEYTFSKGGVIFVAARLGLNAIEKDYYDSIRSILDIRNNIGIIGGKTNKAHYFIGKCAEGLLYLDPHSSQNAIPDRKSLTINTNFNTYSVKHMYVLDLADMSPCFTIGFMFKNYEDYIKLIDDLTEHSNREYPIFKLNTYK